MPKTNEKIHKTTRNDYLQDSAENVLNVAKFQFYLNFTIKE